MRLYRNPVIGAAVAIASLYLFPAAAQEEDIWPELMSAYSAGFGVDIEEVNSVLAQQKSANDLAAKLEATIPGDYAGMRLLPGKNFKAHVYLKSGDSAVLANYTTSSVYEVRKSKYSLDELRLFMNEATAVLSGTGLPYTVAIDLERQDVKISMPNPQSVRALLAPMEARQVIRVVIEDRLARSTVAANQAGTISGYTCTSGFTVKHTDGRRGTTTAGHCPNSSFSVGGASVPFVEQALTTAKKRDLQWHTKTGVTFDAKVWQGSSGTTPLNVVSTSVAAVNTYLCLYGATSGLKCGFVTHTNNAGSVQLLGTSTLVPFENAVSFRASSGTMCAEGDSGAAVFNLTTGSGNATAYGGEFAGMGTPVSNNPKTFQECLYVKAADYSTLGLSIATN